MLCDGDGAEMLQPWEWEDSHANDVLIQTLSGIGEPWRVVYDRVVVRSNKSADSAPLGVVLKGDVFGIDEEDDNWVRLPAGADARVRQKAGTAPRPEHIPQNADGRGAWLMVDHVVHKRLIEPVPPDWLAGGARGLGAPDLLLTPARRGVYVRVCGICQRRIWAENVDTLWEGKEERLCGVETLEAKLFQRGVTVFHARKGGRFVGGAIVRTARMKVWLEVRYENGDVIPVSHDDECSSQSMEVTYVDCAATEVGSRVGRDLWQAICGLPTALVALHSIPVPETVEFWKSRGARFFDSERESDGFFFSPMGRERRQQGERVARRPRGRTTSKQAASVRMVQPGGSCGLAPR